MANARKGNRKFWFDFSQRLVFRILFKYNSNFAQKVLETLRISHLETTSAIETVLVLFSSIPEENFNMTALPWRLYLS